MSKYGLSIQLAQRARSWARNPPWAGSDGGGACPCDEMLSNVESRHACQACRAGRRGQVAAGSERRPGLRRSLRIRLRRPAFRKTESGRPCTSIVAIRCARGSVSLRANLGEPRPALPLLQRLLRLQQLHRALRVQQQVRERTFLTVGATFDQVDYLGRRQLGVERDELCRQVHHVRR